ncbi:MAG: UDP-N-acetylmuramate dehydrogenase [Holosporales bacterium]|jgi:UDP-N-acetylmuramate dehydrogenase|nr:UDP-N-acetylmuramate dehydrogenase [Holosporales bacterium]
MTNKLDQLELLKEFSGVSFDVPLGRYSTMKCGGSARCVYRARNVEELSHFRKMNTFPETLLGGLSNVIVRTSGIGGVVIRLQNTGECDTGEHSVFWAGVRNFDACRMVAKEGLSGMEFLIGIPGTIGGAVAMNAGANGVEIADVLEWVDVVDTSGDVRRIARHGLNFSYRSSGLAEGIMVVRACFRLTPSSQTEVEMRHTQLLLERAKKIKFLPNIGTAGSTFKNPEQNVSNGMKAWELIDSAGCRGLTCGGAMISTEHANFLINTGNATADDLEKLGEEVRKRVFDMTGILLEWEIKIIGD